MDGPSCKDVIDLGGYRCVAAGKRQTQIRRATHDEPGDRAVATLVSPSAARIGLR